MLATRFIVVLFIALRNSAIFFFPVAFSLFVCFLVQGEDRLTWRAAADCVFTVELLADAMMMNWARAHSNATIYF